ncbi:hypothetical protein AVEN_255385-1 [Araneus ventricosus]|uniref:Uncharacterized protein n=1 Tax=Araneus ventricosus TaxID=182803 RepID=A0A4Y2SGY1_ARAVE|nr:hypothetical protein AVEN_255385-1 [Araneus ventricosus]
MWSEDARKFSGPKISQATGEEKSQNNQLLNSRQYLTRYIGHNNTHNATRNVTWSDASRFYLFQNDGFTRVRKEPHEVMRPSFIVPTLQANGGSIMIWVA